MKNIRQFHLLSSILGGVFLFSSCSVVPKAEEKNLSEQWPVVASYQWAGQDSVVVCDLSLLKDTVDLPFSFFLKDFQIIKLDNRDEAMVGENNLCVSENYILVYGSVYELHPCRLFTKKGEFVTNIGAIGQIGMNSVKEGRVIVKGIRKRFKEIRCADHICDAAERIAFKRDRSV